jgi:hypothetical protein
MKAKIPKKMGYIKEVEAISSITSTWRKRGVWRIMNLHVWVQRE